MRHFFSMVCRAHQFTFAAPYSSEGVEEFARTVAAQTGSPSALAVAFVSSDYLPHVEEWCDLLRVRGKIVELLGCTSLEAEGCRGTDFTTLQQGFQLLTFQVPDAQVTSQKILAEDTPLLSALQQPHTTVFTLFDPYHFSLDGWLQRVNAVPGGLTCVGGVASGSQPESTGVFLNGQMVPGGVVTCLRSPHLVTETVVSQGCRPIGEPLTVTRAENNVVFSLGGQPAYQALDTAFQTLSQEEKSTARGNLFAGLATTEYVDDFIAGDFLIRNIIGADPNSGAVVIAGSARIGQTLQYQYRDRHASTTDLQSHLHNVASRQPQPPFASLLFRCLARGSSFFGSQGHDALMLQQLLGNHPSIAMACNGEIGPLHSVNCLTAYTASATLFYQAPSAA